MLRRPINTLISGLHSARMRHTRTYGIRITIILILIMIIVSVLHIRIIRSARARIIRHRDAVLTLLWLRHCHTTILLITILIDIGRRTLGSSSSRHLPHSTHRRHRAIMTRLKSFRPLA